MSSVLFSRMDQVSAGKAKPDHISFAQTDTSSTLSSTAATLTGNHTSQARNGSGMELPLHSTAGKTSARPPSLAQKESSQYQLVFGIEDTSSETSLTDSPLLHDPSNRLLQHFPPPLQDASSESSQASRVCGYSSTVMNADAGSLGASAERENSGVDATAGSPFNPPSTQEDLPVDRVDVAPVKGEELQKDVANHDTKVISNGNTPSDSPRPRSGSVPTASPRSHSQSPDRAAKEPDQFLALRSRSTSPEEVGYQQKARPLSFLTSDSDLGETPTPSPAPPYSPVLNTSGEQDHFNLCN